MYAREIVADLRSRGIELRVEGDLLVVNRGTLTEADAATITEHTNELFACLRVEAATIPQRPQFTWTREGAETMLSTVLERCNYWRDNASPKVQPRIEAVLQEFQPILVKPLEKGDFEGLRLVAIALQRAIGDIDGQANQE